MAGLAAAGLLAQLLVVGGSLPWWQAALAAGAVVVAAERFAGAARTKLHVRLCTAVVAAAVLAAVASGAPAPMPASLASLFAGDARSTAKLAIVADVVAQGSARASGASLVIALVSANGRSVDGRARLFVRHARQRWPIGERIAFRSTLRRLSNFGNPRELDWVGWNLRRGIRVSAFVWDDRDIEARGGAPTIDRVTAFRRGFSELVAGRGPPAALLAALVVGDRAQLPLGVVEAIRAAGLAHLLAISGLHVGIVVAALVWLGGRLVARTALPRSGRDPVRVVAGLAAAGLVGYAAISGGGVAVARASVMGALVLAAMWRGRLAGTGSGLIAAASALAVARPGVVVEAGFHLSFAAAAVIVTYAARLRPAWLAGLPAGLRHVCDAVAIALLCWAVTTPLVAQHFNRVAVLGPLANLLAAVPVAATVGLGLAVAVAHALLPPAAAWLLPLAEGAAACVLAVAQQVAALPGCEAEVVSPGWLLASAAAGVPFALALDERARRRVLAVLVAAAACAVVLGCYQRYRDDRLAAVFPSVGQGDAAIVRLPGGEVLVVDGGRPGRGRIVVGPLLRKLRVATIDYLVVTHVQEDHWGGLADLAGHFTIRELWHPAGVCTSQAFHRFTDRLVGGGTRMVAVGSDRPLRQGRAGWRIEALWPAADQGECSDNDRSIVLRLELAGHALLLTGDVEAHAERTLATQRPESLAATVLKVPHHGSRTSSTAAFVSAVSPRVAIASAGLDNRYGFPHAEVVDRYRRAGAAFLGTATDGAVRVHVDRAGVCVSMAGEDRSLGRRRWRCSPSRLRGRVD